MPFPIKQEFRKRWLFDPPPGYVHIIDLINKAKDGIYTGDILSDQVIGTLILAFSMGIIKEWEAKLFYVPFTGSWGLRHGWHGMGRPLLGPDKHIMCLDGQPFPGDSGRSDLSQLDLETIQQYPGYDRWIETLLFRGRTLSDTTYQRIYEHDTRQGCEEHTMATPYEPGPLSLAPDGNGGWFAPIHPITILTVTPAHSVTESHNTLQISGGTGGD